MGPGLATSSVPTTNVRGGSGPAELRSSPDLAPIATCVAGAGGILMLTKVGSSWMVCQNGTG